LWTFHWNSRLLTPRRQKLWEKTQLRHDWEAKLARINNISLFSQPSFGFPLVDEDHVQLSRSFTVYKAEILYYHLADPDNPYEPAILEEG
jgi:hypothetical protein